MRTTLAITAAVTACAATAAVAFVPPAGDSRSDRAEVSRGSSARSAAWNCDRTATSGESLASKFRAAKPGRTVCLAEAELRHVSWGRKVGDSSPSAPNQARRASLSLEFNGAKEHPRSRT